MSSNSVTRSPITTVIKNRRPRRFRFHIGASFDNIENSFHHQAERDAIVMHHQNLKRSRIRRGRRLQRTQPVAALFQHHRQSN